MIMYIVCYNVIALHFNSPCSVYGSRCGDEECPTSFCHACYFSAVDQPFPSPGNCGPACLDYTVRDQCTRKWATCTRRAHFKAYGEVRLYMQGNLLL